jgi:hypothetical protein
MTIRQSAEHLAAIRLRFPLWSVRPVSGGAGWTGHRGARRVWAATLDALEAEMRGAQRGMGADPSHVLGRLRRKYPAWQITSMLQYRGWRRPQGGQRDDGPRHGRVHRRRVRDGAR